MGCQNFKQYDTRWGKLGYVRAPETMSTSGCGATACADIISANPKYAEITPKDTRNYMINHNYAVQGAGTAWAGIASCLSNYGFKVTNHPTMAEFFEEMAKGDRYAVVLFSGGTRGGVTWTTGGHYVACDGYKTQNGKHYMHMLDPGARNHDGWFCYEAHMKGLIPQIWSCYIPKHGIFKENGAYYFYNNGTKRTKCGWFKFKDRQYYSEKGGKLKTYGYYKIAGKWRVFSKAGNWLCKDCTTTVKSKWFKSNANGVVTQHQFWDKLYIFKQADYALTTANGCMPTSLAMIVSSLMGKKTMPVTMANKLAKYGDWDKKTGGLGAGSADIAKEYGLKYKYYMAKDFNLALDFMRKHEALMIVRQEGGTFTDGIHYIAIMDIKKNHNVLVYNPGKKGANGWYDFDKYVKLYLRDQKGEKTKATNGSMCVIYK